MRDKTDKELQQRILNYLVECPSNDTVLLVDCCRSEAEEKIFYTVLEDMVNRKVIDWHPLDKNVLKDESVPFGEFARIYHIARPDFTEVVNYVKKLAAKIRSRFYC